VKTAPRTDRGRAAVAGILDAACASFAARGVRATTLDAVGAAAGVGRGQLYHYFRDKDDLVAEVVAAQVEKLLAPLNPLIAGMSRVEDLRTWCAESVARYAGVDAGEAIRCPLGSLIIELDGEHAAARVALQAGFSRWQDMLAGALSRIAARGELAPGLNPDAVASALLAAYQGGVLLADLHRDVDHLSRALHVVVDAVGLPGRTEFGAAAAPRSAR
jgi:AcrR family transcriptional regulator